MITGIVVALSEELTTLTTAKVEQGQICKLSDSILVAFAGAGPTNACKAAQILHDNGATRLISWGCAAALSPTLQPGNLVIPAKLMFTGKAPLHANSAWLQHSKRLLADDLTLTSGVLVGSNALVASAIDKQTVYQQSQGDAVALDMESYAVAEYATNNKLDWLVFRAIADPVSMSLPTIIGKSMSTDGTVNIPKLISQILLQPWQIPALIKLGLHFGAAKQTLRSVAQYLDKIVGFNPDSETS